VRTRADLIAIVDMEGKRLYNSVSYQKALGYSPEELQARPLSSRFTPMIVTASSKLPSMRGTQE